MRRIIRRDPADRRPRDRRRASSPSTAYQAGLQTAVTTTAEGTGTTVVVPGVRRYGYGWHPFGFGFGFFGFLGSPAVLRSSCSGSSGPSSAAAGTAIGRSGLGTGRADGSGRTRRRAFIGQPVRPLRPLGGRPPPGTSTNGTAGAHGPVGDGTGTPGPAAGPTGTTPPAPAGSTSRPSAPGPSVRGRIRLPHPTTMPPMRTVLVVDDEARIVQLARDYLEHAGLRGADRGRRTVGARDRPPAPSRPRRPRHRAARARRPRRHPRAPPRLVDPDRDADRPRRRARQAARASSSAPTTTSPSRSRRASWSRASRPSCAGPSGATAAGRRHPRRRRGPRRAADADRGGRPGRRPHRDRVRAAGHAGAPAPGRIFTRSQLLDALRGVAFESYERAIDSHIKNLRRKVEPDPREPRYVLTVYGVGYRFADDRGAPG